MTNQYDLIVMRLKAGLKQYEIAAVMGISPTIICDIERGRRSITPEIVKHIREAINEAKNRKTIVAGER